MHAIRTNKKRAAVLGLAALALTCLSACGDDDAAGSSGECSVTLGVIGPMTGPAAGFGQAIKDAAEYAVAEANEEGFTVGGEDCTLRTKTLDSEYSSAGGATAANTLAADGVNFVMGPVASIELDGVKPIADRNEMLLMTTAFGAKDLGPEYPLIFHVFPGPFVWSGPVIEAAQEFYDFERVTVVGPNDASGLPTVEINDDRFTQAGAEVATETYERGTTDFTSLVQRIADSGPDVVDLAGTPAGDAGIIVKELRQGGYDGQFARLGGESTAEIARVAGGLDVLGDFWFYSPTNFDDPAQADLLEDVKATLGRDPIPVGMAELPAAQALIRAISEADSVDDVEGAAEALRNDPLEDPVFGQGTWTGDEQFGISQEISYPVYLGRLQGGEYLPFEQVDLG